MQELTVSNGVVYFSGDVYGGGHKQLYRVDEKLDGIRFVKKQPINNRGNYTGGGASNLTSVGDLLFFEQYETGGSAKKLWATDGTEAGTHIVNSNSNSWQGSFNSVAFKNLLFFVSATPENGYELWRTDGTESGTFFIKDINPGVAGSNPTKFMVAGDLLYFFAGDNVHGTELWKTDGTPEGTNLVKDINPGISSSYPLDWWSQSADWSRCFAYGNGYLYFTANDGVHGDEPWRTDGTEAGTFMVKDIHPGEKDSKPVNYKFGNGIVYFAAAATSYTTQEPGFVWTYYNSELYRSDGTASGTYMIKDINENDRNGSNINCLMVHDGKLLFAAIDESGVYRLFLSDGTAAGTQPMVKGKAGEEIASPFGFLKENHHIYFCVSKGKAGFEIWRTDGRSEGTVRLCASLKEWAGDAPTQMKMSQGDLYFTTRQSSRLWRTKVFNLADANGTPFFAFPNPFQNHFTIQLRDEIVAEEFDLSLFDYLGKNVYHGKFQGNDQMEITALDNLVPGIYMLTLKYGDKSYSQKLIKSE